MTREFFRSRMIGGLFRGVGIVPASKRLAEPFLVRRVLEKLKAGRSVVIFPEGGARWDGRPMEWMPSTVKLFVRSGFPVHPLRIHGSYTSFPRWADYPRPSRVTIEALPPITFDRKTDTDEAMAQLRAITDFDENVTRTDCHPTHAYKPASGIHRLLYRDPWDDSGPMTTEDGRTVVTASGRHRLVMGPDSILHDETDGSTYTTAELYDRIKQMAPPGGSGSPVLDDAIDLHIEHTFPDLQEVGRSQARLYDEHVMISGNGVKRVIDLDNVLYCDTERNRKLQLYLRDADEAMIQLTFFDRGSALQWKDTLERMRPELVGLGGGGRRTEDTPS